MDNYLYFLFNLEKTQLLQEISFRRFKTCEKALLILLSCSVIIAVLEENFFFESEFLLFFDHYYNLAGDFNPGQPNSSKVLRIINCVILFPLIVMIYLRKKAYFTFLKSISMIDLSTNMFSSFSFIELIFEMMVLMVQTYPNDLGSMINYQRQWRIVYMDDSILTFCCVGIRIAFIIRSSLYMTKFSTPKSIKICMDNGVYTSLMFALKAEFHLFLKRFVFAFMIIIILNNGILLRLCERSAEVVSFQDWDYIWNSFWCVIVTLTTVGYGDIVPATDNGRVMIGLTAILGSLITSMICIIFMIEFSFSHSQENSYERIKASESTLKLNDSASRCIGLAVRFNLKVKKATNEERNMLYDQFYVDIKKKVREFRTWKKIIVDFKHNRKLERRLLTISDDINDHLDELSVLMSYYDYVSEKLDTLLKNQKNLLESNNFIENYYQRLILQIDHFSDEYMTYFKEFKKVFLGSSTMLENYSSILDIQTANSLQKIPLIQLEESTSESNFLLFSKRKPRYSSASRLSKTTEKKIKKITMGLEKHLSINSPTSLNKPTKSVLLQDSFTPIDEIDENSYAKMDISKDDRKVRKLSISTRKKKLINNETTQKLKSSLEKFRKSLSHSSSSKKQYPTFDAISNHELTNINYLDDSSGPKIEEKEEIED